MDNRSTDELMIAYLMDPTMTRDEAERLAVAEAECRREAALAVPAPRPTSSSRTGRPGGDRSARPGGTGTPQPYQSA